MFPGCRSSDFFCLVHFAVALSTASRISLATLRGRLVMGLLCIVSEDDRTLASVGELNARRGQMKRTDHGLVSVGAHLGQRAFKSLPRRSERVERVGDRRAKVGPGHEDARHRAALRQAGLMQPETELDDIRN